MIIAFLAFRFAQWGLSNLFNFIFACWYVDYLYLYLTGILMLLVICFPRTRPYAKTIFYTVFILSATISIFVLFKSVTPIILAAVIALDTLFLIILITARMNVSILKKIVMIIL